MFTRFKKLNLNQDQDKMEMSLKFNNPTMRKILKDAYIQEGDETNIKTLVSCLEYHYKDMSIPFGHIKLLESNTLKIPNRKSIGM